MGFNCEQCGKCCEKSGRFYWQDSPIADKNPLLILVKRLTAKSNDTGRCLMLRYDDEGRAYCILQEVFGYEAKPKKCCEYPPIDEKCPRGLIRSD